MRRLAVLSSAALLVLGGSSVAQSPPAKRIELRLERLQPRIVNGVSAMAMIPEAAFLIRTDAGGGVCSGTLIGCQTLLTAAHCVESFDPAHAFVYLQHGGIFNVTGAVINPDFEFGVRSDVALVTLAQPVTGVAPIVINNGGEPPLGTTVTLAGYGGIGNPTPALAPFHNGLLRTGSAVTSGCTVVPESSHICFTFDDPGAPGSDSNACFGDSGGPMFINGLGPSRVVVGVTSANDNPTCLSTTETFYADVSFDRDWIVSQAAGDLAPIQCSTLPTALGPNTMVDSAEDSLNAGEFVNYEAHLGAGFTRLRITLNGEVQPAQNYNLYVKFGSAPTVTPPNYDCGSASPFSLEACDFASPPEGSYFILVDNPANHSGPYQITFTGFGAAVPTWTPSPSPTITPTLTASTTPTASLTPTITDTPTATGTPTITPTASATLSPTITPTPIPCTPLDVDGDETLQPLTDGLLFLRYGFGFSGNTLTQGALGSGATRDAAAIIAFLNGCGSAVDVDGDGAVQPLTDGLLFLRYLFGFRGPTLIASAVGSGCTRCLAGEIEAYLATLAP